MVVSAACTWRERSLGERKAPGRWPPEMASARGPPLFNRLSDLLFVAAAGNARHGVDEPKQAPAGG